MNRQERQQYQREQRLRAEKVARDSEVASLEEEERRLRRELTRQRQVENSIRRSRDHAAQLAQDLEVANNALRRSNKRLKDLAYAVSHDLRAPARQIGSCLELLSSSLTLGPDDEALMGTTLQCRDRLLSMLDDLTRIMLGANSTIDSASAKSALEAARANLATEIESAEATIESVALPTVRGSSTEITQVFQNLLSNSLKYRSEQAPLIQISCRQTRLGFRFGVRDNGQGMDPERAERAFLPFQRLTNLGSGSGIGLSIVRSIIETLGGTIWVESEENVGSTFFFELPKSENTLVSNRQFRILLIHDQPRERSLTRSAIEHCLGQPAEILGVHGGEAAIAFLQLEPVDAIVINYDLSAMSGLETVRLIRASDSEASILAISARSTSEWKEEALGVGAHHVTSEHEFRTNTLASLELVLDLAGS